MNKRPSTKGLISLKIAKQIADNALSVVARHYADKVIAAMHRPEADPWLNARNCRDAIWEDERPGGLPAEYDTVVTRRAMERHILEAYQVRK